MNTQQKAVEEAVERLIIPAFSVQKFARDDGSTERSEAEFRAAAREALATIATQATTETLARVRKQINETKLRIGSEEYLDNIEKWDGKNYDQAFDDGFDQAKKQLLQALDTLQE